MAYVSPGSIDPQNIVVDPTTDINVGPAPRLIIPKINVDVPVHYDIGNDYASQMKAMESGTGTLCYSWRQQPSWTNWKYGSCRPQQQ